MCVQNKRNTSFYCLMQSKGLVKSIIKSVVIFVAIKCFSLSVVEDLIVTIIICLFLLFNDTICFHFFSSLSFINNTPMGIQVGASMFVTYPMVTMLWA